MSLSLSKKFIKIYLFNMNFLKNKLLTPFRRADMANSPFHRGINMEEKRSTLFADRRRIPGRKAKVLLTVMFCFQIII